MTNTTVASFGELVSVLSNAQAGDAIFLADGDYGLVSLSNLSFDAPVTIGVADASVALDGLALDTCTGLIFDGLTIDTALSGPVEISNCSDISLTDVTFTGVSSEAVVLEASTSVFVTETAAGTDVSSALFETAQSFLVAEASEATVDAPSLVITVSTAAELAQALEHAVGGETIQLAAGHYGDFTIGKRGVDVAAFDTPVTIVSADAEDRAVFSGLTLQGVKGLTFSEIDFDFVFQSGDLAMRSTPFMVQDSENVVFKGNLFDGDVASNTGDAAADGYPAGIGLTVMRSTGIDIIDNEITNFWKGARITDSHDITMSGNDVNQFRSDGINIVQVGNVLIEDNYLHDRVASYGTGDHGDMIQLWTNNTEWPSHDVTIRGNLIDVGDGDKCQSIFLTNTTVSRDGAGADWYLKNFIIEDNTIINAQKNAINLGPTDNAIVRNNTLVRAPEAFDLGIELGANESTLTPSIYVDPMSSNVVIENNIAPKLQGFEGQDDWSFANNFEIQSDDPNAEGYYGDVFLAPYGDLGGHVEKLQLRADSAPALAGAGSSLVAYDSTPDADVAIALVAQSEAQYRTFHFDASLSAGPDGAFGADGSTYSWDFGDGATAEGLTVTHVYGDAGKYAVTLTVTRPDGETLVTDSEARVSSPTLLSFDTATGQILAQTFGETTVIDTNAVDSLMVEDAVAPPPLGLAPLDAVSPVALDFGAAGQEVFVDYSLLGEVFSAETVAFNMSIEAQAGAGSAGELLRLPRSLRVAVESDGNLSYELTLADGTTTLIKTTAATLTDGAAHDLSITYNKATGTMTIVIDDAVMAEASGLSGSIMPLTKQGMYIGGMSGDAGFDGLVHDFNVMLNEDHYGAPDQQDGLLDAHDSDFAEIDSFFDLSAPVALGAEQSYLALDAGSAKVAGNFGMSISFTAASDCPDQENLIWNHGRFGVRLVDDGLHYMISDADGVVRKTKLAGLGLNDGEAHELVALMDSETDQFLLILDGDIIADDSRYDWDMMQDSKADYGWTLGSTWGNSFQGEVEELSFFIPEEIDTIADHFVL